MSPEKGLYDFELTLILKASNLDLNSENPMGWAKYNVTITNIGVMPDEYTVEASCSNGWPTISSPSTVPIGKSVILPGDSFNISITVVVPPPSRPRAVCDLKVLAQSNDSPQKTTTEEHASIVIHCPLISIPFVTTFPVGPIAGESTTITATLRNDGDFYEPYANVSFFIDGRPIAMNMSAGRMNPGGFKNVTVKWAAVQGSHTIEARTEHWFANDENESQEINIDVRTGQSIGKIELEIDILSSVGIILVVALIIYHKKKGPDRN
jgi:hypothetical protein